VKKLGTLFMGLSIFPLVLVIGVVAWALLFGSRDRKRKGPARIFPPTSGEEEKVQKAE